MWRTLLLGVLQRVHYSAEGQALSGIAAAERSPGAQALLLRGDPTQAGDPSGDHGGVGGDEDFPLATPVASFEDHIARTQTEDGGQTPAKTPVRLILSPWARDALGIFLVVLGLVAVLGVWFDAAGPVGRGLEWVLRGLVGETAVLFPLVGVYWGVLLLRDTAREERLRMFIGFAILSAAVLGMLSLFGGDPSPRRLRRAVGGRRFGRRARRAPAVERDLAVRRGRRLLRSRSSWGC